MASSVRPPTHLHLFMLERLADHSEELRNFPIFRDLPAEILRDITAVKPPPIRRGTTIFRQGNPIHRIFLVLSGEVVLEHRNERGEVVLTRVVRPGQVFGRLELDTLEGQLGSARTTRRTEVLYIEKNVLSRLRSQYPELRNQLDRSEVIGHLRATPYFAPLSDLEIKWISDIVTIEHAERGEVLLRFGEPAQEVVVVRQGRVRLEGESADDRRWVSAGAVIGKRAALAGLQHSASAVTESKTLFYRLPAEDLEAVTALHPEQDWAGEPVRLERLLQNAPIFKDLTGQELRHLAGYTMQLHLHRPHYVVVRQGIQDEYYYILVRGTAIYYSQEVVNGEATRGPNLVMAEGEGFGEASLLLGEVADRTVETLDMTDWLRIHRTDFKLFLHEHPGARARLNIDPELRERLKSEEIVAGWQEEGERIILRARRHWIVLARNLAAVLSGLLLLVGAALAVDVALGFPPLWVMLILSGLLLAGPAVWVILDYRNDFHILTNKRVAHEERVILVSERRVSAPLDKVQEMKIDRGFWAQMLGYGHLLIATAADEGQIMFDYLPNAEVVMKRIDQEVKSAKAGVKADREELIRRQLQDRLHLGLEEKLDERALLEALPRAASQHKPRWRKLIDLMGLHQETGNRLVWRKHWLGLLIQILPPLLFVLAGVLAMILVLAGSMPATVPPELEFVLAIMLLVVLGISFFWLWWKWTDWRNDLYIVTDQNIEHIEKKPFIFDEQKTVTTLERVQNVEYHKPGPIAYLLNYGNVYIQTAAAEGELVFRYVPEPDQVQADIYHRLQRYRDLQARLREKQLKSEMADWLEAYHKLLLEERDRQAQS
ncbi:MAG: hypothetical protein D6791_18340 [Chloroflexi bacterium]|nr:MAG: hypothetical protein D6791_18340 [Chloroflexota bacterium]